MEATWGKHAAQPREAKLVCASEEKMPAGLAAKQELVIVFPHLRMHRLAEINTDPKRIGPAGQSATQVGRKRGKKTGGQKRDFRGTK